MPAILFPSDYFQKNKVDPELQNEFNTCVLLNYDIYLFDYQEWYTNHICILTKEPLHMTTTIYRGWMMKPEEYSIFYKQLQDHNIQLFTNEQEYSNLHIFPNIYPYIKQDTPKIQLFPIHQPINLEEIQFSKFLVKDSVKSVKGTNFPNYFDKSMTQEEFNLWMNQFYQYRGSLLTGDICIKEFVPLKKYNGFTNEYRVFYFDHQILSICRNSNQSIYCSLPPDVLINKYTSLPSPYYTIDFAQLENNQWVLIECGDGQVSGLSSVQDYTFYFKELKKLLDPFETFS